MTRVLIFVVAYNAENTLADVLNRIPEEILSEHETDLLIIDDASSDKTFEVGDELGRRHPQLALQVLKNPENLGYGGNQKLGYQYAIREGYDIVVLLHGDGQYAPEQMPQLIRPLAEGSCDAVFGSRMMQGRSALKGGMPLYKYIGNRILTSIQNWMTGMQLSEWHSGYRLYSVEALKRIPFDRNSDDFDFDTEIILQLQVAGCRIEEHPVPTFYGDEICHVDGLKYAWQVIKATTHSVFRKLGILYDPKFDVIGGESPYREKFGFASSHRFAQEAVQPNDRLLILGCGPVETIRPLIKIASRVVLVDLLIEAEHAEISDKSVQADLNLIESSQIGDEEFDCVLLLDVIEHLNSPEEFLSRLRRWKQCQDARFVFTTPNIAFFPVRAMLSLGQFNYGPRGILDRTHTRLFTFGSFKRLMKQQGYNTIKTRGIPAPFPLAVGDNWLGRLLLAANQTAIVLSKHLFSYQIYWEAVPRPTVERLLGDAETHTISLREAVTN